MKVDAPWKHLIYGFHMFVLNFQLILMLIY